MNDFHAWASFLFTFLSERNNLLAGVTTCSFCQACFKKESEVNWWAEFSPAVRMRHDVVWTFTPKWGQYFLSC